MNKNTLRSVIISSLCFLATIWALFFVAQQYYPMQTTTANATQQKKIAYLTFDDGPSRYTSDVLKILKENNVKATFFVTGSNPDFYDLIKEEAAQGHAIGIHTFSHDYGKIYSSEDAYFKDVAEMNALIKKEIGHEVKILRFPGGSSNTVSRKYSNGIMSALTKDVEKKGYQYYDWNAANGDGNCYIESSTLVNTALKEIRDQDVVMMLMHDGSSSKATIDALPTILKSMLRQGYEFKVIDEKTPVFHHHVAN